MRTLVLNAGFQPTAVISARRAVVLLLDNLAECVEPSGVMFRAASLQIEAPAVIRLTRSIKVPWRSTAPVTRRGVLTRDGRRCAYCHRPAATIDHVMPRSRGGRHEWTNVVAACGPCNHVKADRTPREANMTLHVHPTEPKGVLAFALTLPEVHPAWRTWLGLPADTVTT